MGRQLVPDRLGELFLRVMPEALVRPQGRGRRRADDRGALVRIFPLPPRAAHGGSSHPCSGRHGLPRITDSRTGPEPASGPNSTAWSSTHWAPVESWSGRGARSNRRVRGRQERGHRPDRIRPIAASRGRSPSDHRPERTAAVARHLRCQHAGQAKALSHPCATSRPSAPLAARVADGPGKLHADKGYEDDHLRRWFVSAASATASLAGASSPHSGSADTDGWSERAVSCPSGCRRLHRRCERKSGRFLAFVGIAAALLCHRRRTD